MLLLCKHLHLRIKDALAEVPWAWCLHSWMERWKQKETCMIYCLVMPVSSKRQQDFQDTVKQLSSVEVEAIIQRNEQITEDTLHSSQTYLREFGARFPHTLYGYPGACSVRPHLPAVSPLLFEPRSVLTSNRSYTGKTAVVCVRSKGAVDSHSVLISRKLSCANPPAQEGYMTIFRKRCAVWGSIPCGNI